MKNLILTTGILLLMITGMIYDQDCRNLIETQRRLKWVCEEAAYGAAVKLWREGKSLQEAEAAAEEILRRNLDTVQWEMEMKDGVVEIRADLGEVNFHLPFLQELVRAERRDTFDFYEKFFGKRAETS
ncbi:MAG: hypothetical protein ACI4LN_03900 [Anaerovoracaceae bacterium]